MHPESVIIARLDASNRVSKALIEAGFTHHAGIFDRGNVRVVIARNPADLPSIPSRADVFISGKHDFVDLTDAAAADRVLALAGL